MDFRKNVVREPRTATETKKREKKTIEKTWRVVILHRLIISTELD
jgi:hypothetical protein